MLLFVAGPADRSRARAERIQSAIAERWPKLARSKRQPRTGAPLQPALTRLDRFLEAFAPAGIPAADGWWSWVPSLRRALRELILATYPPGWKVLAPCDPGGPSLARPSAAGTKPLRSLASEFQGGVDPAQRPVDPRLWLVLAPSLPAELETLLLSSFLRAEPFARTARAPGDVRRLDSWLRGEVDALVAGNGLASRGLVADLDWGASPASLTVLDEDGQIRQRTDPFDLASGLEELYATRETLAPGEAYNRLHSHTGSEELYIVLEGEGVIRVNERALPIRAGQCFGKPRGYDCATQILNTGSAAMVLLDVGTANRSELDLWHYPEHGELVARLPGQPLLVPKAEVLPGSEFLRVYDRRYYRAAKSAPRSRRARPNLSG